MHLGLGYLLLQRALADDDLHCALLHAVEQRAGHSLLKQVAVHVWFIFQQSPRLARWGYQ